MGIGNIIILTLSALILAHSETLNHHPDLWYPPGDIFGYPLSKWSAIWWQHVYSLPLEKNQLFDYTGEFCQLGQAGPMWFLFGVWGIQSVTRKCKIPCGVSLLIPLQNSVRTDGPYFNGILYTGYSHAYPDAWQSMMTIELQEFNSEVNISGMDVIIDNKHVPDLASYRSGISHFFDLWVPWDNTFAMWGERVPEGPYKSITEGYYVTVKPLSEGHHTVYWKTEFYETKYELEVSCDFKKTAKMPDHLNPFYFKK